MSERQTSYDRGVRWDVLPGGLRVVHVPRRETKQLTVVLGVNAGSRYETASTNGLAHLLEHMAYKGTRTFHTPQAYNQATERIGAEANAFTHVEFTTYYLQCPDWHYQEAFELLAEVTLRPTLSGRELRQERRVITEELLGVSGDQDSVLDELLEQNLYGRSHPLGWPIGGTPGKLRQQTAAVLRRFHDRFYVSGNMALAVVSDLPYRVLRPALVRAFRGARRGHQAVPLPWAGHELPPSAQRRMGDQPQTAIALGTPALRFLHPERQTLRLLYTALGGSMTSRLYNRIREQAGLTYDISSDAENYRETGHLVSKFHCAPQRSLKVVQLALEEYRRLRDQGVASAELELARRHLRDSLIMKLEDQYERALFYLLPWLMHGRRRSIGSELRNSERITVERFNRFAKSLLRQPPLVAVVGQPLPERRLRELLGRY